MSSLELKIPPDVVWLAVAALMWLTSRATPGLVVAESLRRAVALLLLAAGAGLIVAGRIALDRAGTTWHPTEPGRATSLVTSGVYRFSRNPTYVGMELVLLSWAVVLANPSAAVVSVVFVAYVGRFQVLPEERTLSLMFGEDYRDYVQRVRRWV
jgi:protein-S-isoprenylcysteine O-methyltransferase Ste14